MTSIITERPLDARVATLPWDDLEAQLDTRGFAVTDPLVGAAECGGQRTALGIIFHDAR